MTPSQDDKSLWSRLTQGAPLAVIVAAVLYILYKLLPVLKLIAIAMLIAVILRTLLRWLEMVIKVRSVAVLCLVGLLVGFVGFVATVIIPSVLSEAQTLLTTIPEYLNALSLQANQLHRHVRFFPDLSESLTQARSFIAQWLGTFPSLLQQAFDITIEAAATSILALYIAYDPNSLVIGFLKLVPRHEHQRFHRILKMTEIRLRGWIFGTGIAMLFLGVSTTLGLWALGIPLALPFGLIAGLFEVIPYFGSIFGTFLPALIALTISPWKLALVLLLFLVLNQVDAYLVQPLVMGQQVKLPPVVVIITFLVMGRLLGFVGVLLAVPTVAILMTLVDEFSERETIVIESAIPNQRSHF
jgi:predicted PurR-regulated permease PerM